jgi:BON domain
MKTDSRLKADSSDELACDPAINAPGIGVMVKDGVATLAGHLDTLSGKHAVERAVRRAATGQGALSGGARRRRKRGVLPAVDKLEIAARPGNGRFFSPGFFNPSQEIHHEQPSAAGFRFQRFILLGHAPLLCARPF